MIMYLKGIITFFLVTIFVNGTVFAHESGSPYVKINSDYALGNPILSVAEPTEFVVGADVASSSGYLVGQSITFTIDEEFFPNPYAQAQNSVGIPIPNAPGVPQPMFRWDFQDGSPPVEGKSVRHTFTQSGTYIVELAAKFVGKTDDFSVINTVQIDVYPTRNYEPQKPKIIVNGKTIVDPQRDTAPIKPVAPVSFEATTTSSNMKYHWDFGDGNGAEGQSVTHRYARDEFFPIVVLRTTDEHNISVDTYALLDMPFEKPNILMSFWYKINDFFVVLFSR